MNMGVYPEMDDVLRRSRRGLRQGRAGLLRRRLPLSAARRHLLRLSLRSRAARDAARSAATIPEKQPRDLRRHGPRRARRTSRPTWRSPMHLCRGNFRSTFIASGGYEPVAELLFNSMPRRRLFHGMGHRPRRRLRAAALPAQGQDASCSASSRRRPACWKARTTSSAASRRPTKFVDLDQLCLSPAMRLRLDGGGQHARRGRAMGQASHDRRGRRRRSGAEPGRARRPGCSP